MSFIMLYTFLCADVSVGNLLGTSLLSDGGHCQGACRLQMFFYIPLWRWDRLPLACHAGHPGSNPGVEGTVTKCQNLALYLLLG